MKPEFITYQKFNDAALAHELSDLFEKNNIAYLIQEETSGFDPSMVMSNAVVDYAVKIKSEDVELANSLVKQNAEDNIEAVNSDHYLFSFTDDELMEVITKADEWSAFDVVLARKILIEREKTISDQDIADINDKRIEELKTVKPLSDWWLFVSYMLAFAPVGIPVGWYLKSAKKTLPDGERIYSFTEQDRKHGRRIFYIGIVSFILIMLNKFGIIPS